MGIPKYGVVPMSWSLKDYRYRKYTVPGVPAASKREPIDAACPTHHVDTGGNMYCIVSYIARPAVTLPPGL